MEYFIKNKNNSEYDNFVYMPMNYIYPIIKMHLFYNNLYFYSSYEEVYSKKGKFKGIRFYNNLIPRKYLEDDQNIKREIKQTIKDLNGVKIVKNKTYHIENNYEY